MTAAALYLLGIFGLAALVAWAAGAAARRVRQRRHVNRMLRRHVRGGAS